MNVPKYMGIGLAMVTGALAASQKGSIQVSDGLIGSADRGISGVGLPVKDAVVLGNGSKPKMPVTLLNGLINGTSGASVALGFLNASQSHTQAITIEQSKEFTTEVIKEALAKEIEKGSFKEKRLTAKDVKDLKLLTDQEPHDVSHGIPFNFPDDNKNVYVWKPGKIMVIDKQKYNAECHIDADTGRVKLNKEQVIGSPDLKAATSKTRVKR